MAIAYSFGEALVTHAELVALKGQPKFDSFMENLAAGTSATFAFSTGTASSDEMLVPNEAGDLIAAQPIGIGKPLTVMIRHIYTGAFGNKDLLVTSRMKSFGAVQGDAEAINLIRSNVAKRDNLRGAGADDEGTPVVFYMKALTKPDNVVTIKLDLDDFKEEWFDTIGNAATGLSKIPALALAQPWLLVGSLVIKAAGKLLKPIFEKKYFFREDESISFTIPGDTMAREGFALLMKDTDYALVRKDHKVDPTSGALIKINGGDRYDGEAPYVVLTLDGTQRDDQLGDFQRTAATVATLKRFRPDGDANAQVDELLKVVGAFSDLKFRRAADAKDEELRALPAGSQFDKERERLQTERDANMANVRSDELKATYKP